MARALKPLVPTTPIVAISNDPIARGLVDSLARSGGNITGVSVDAGLEIWGKRLSILKEAVKTLSKPYFLDYQERLGLERRRHPPRRGQATGSFDLDDTDKWQH